MATIVKFEPGVGKAKSKTFQLQPVDVDGNPASVEAGTWKIEDVVTGKCFGELLEDGLVKVNRGVLDSGEFNNQSEFNVIADADKSSGERYIMERFIVFLSEPEAVGFGVTETATEIDNGEPAPTDTPTV